MGDFLLRVQRVDWGVDAAKTGDGMKDDCVFRHVRTQNSKDFAFLKAAPAETGSDARNGANQL